MPCLAIGLYLVSIRPFWGGAYMKLPAHINNVYRWYGLGSETLVTWGCFGLRASCGFRSAYSLALSASALMGAAFGSGMGGVRKFV